MEKEKKFLNTNFFKYKVNQIGLWNNLKKSKKVPLTIASKKMKYLGKYLSKETQDFNTENHNMSLKKF